MIDKKFEVEKLQALVMEYGRAKRHEERVSAEALFQQITSDLAALATAATKREQALQAKIDTLMLEYCPDEMPPEQMAEWERNQVMYQGDGRNKALTSRISTQIEDRWLYNGAKRSSKNVAAGKLAEAETSATAAVGGEWIAQVVSSGPANFSLLEWRFAELSISTPIGTKLYASVEGKTND